VLAKGGYERVSDFGTTISEALDSLVADGSLQSVDELEAVGFKTVLGKDVSGCVEADEATLAALDGMAAIAPAHNPAYAAGIRQFKRLTKARLVALFETSFYQWVPQWARHYAIPRSWHAAGVRRNGFHGASHKFIAERSAELCGRDDIAARVRDLYVRGCGDEPEGTPLRVVSCHLGGSSSVTGIRNGLAIGCSMGLSPQSGLPHNNRVGDLDVMALPLIMETRGISMEAALAELNKESGLLGLSGVSNDLRDIADAADGGNPDAAMAIDFLVGTIRHYIGAYAFQMGGLDALVFTAGIGENRADIRAKVCSGLEDFGIQLDAAANDAVTKTERILSAPASRVRVCVIPANEERVVARETWRKVTNVSEK
jgi:acetate kinase